MNHRLVDMQTVEPRRQLSNRDDELDAARAANRGLMTRLNKPRGRAC